MARLAPRSSSWRAASVSRVNSSVPKLWEFFSGAFSSSSDTIARSSTSRMDSVFRSQESHEFDRLATAPQSCPDSIVLDRQMQQRLRVYHPVTRRLKNWLPRSCSRRLFPGVRVRGLGQIARGFSSISVEQQVNGKCWSCGEMSAASPFFVYSACRIQFNHWIQMPTSSSSCLWVVTPSPRPLRAAKNK